MPSHPHETLVEMFRHRPQLAPELLGDLLGFPVPSFRDARPALAEATVLSPAELHVDAVVLLENGTEQVGVVLVEVQSDRDADKRWSWPVYVTSVRRRWQCPAYLLVVCTDRSVARWAAAPIPLDGGGSRLCPVVVGPDLLPVITDPGTAVRNPELTVLSVLAHATDLGSLSVLDVLVDALSTVHRDLASEYSFLVLNALSDRARAHLEDLMAAAPYMYDNVFTRQARAEGVAEGLAEGLGEGEARGRAAIVLRILERRGVDVPDDARARILGCTDLAQLESWGDRAIDAATIDDVL